MKNTLLLIFAALALMIGSFIWFVATWDASKEESINFIWPNKLIPTFDLGAPPAAGALFIEKGTT